MLDDGTSHKRKKKRSLSTKGAPHRSPPASEFRLAPGRRLPHPFEDSMIPDEIVRDEVPTRAGSTPVSPASSPSLKRRASASVFGFARGRSSKGFTKKSKNDLPAVKEKNLHAKSPKGLGSMIRSSLSPLGRRHASMPDAQNPNAKHVKRRTRKRRNSNSGKQQTDYGFVITPPGLWEGTSLMAEMVRRMESYHKATEMKDELPSLVLATRVLLSIFTSFPPKMLVCLLCRFEGNSKAVIEELELLGWQPAAKHDFSFMGGGLMSDQRDVHFTTKYYHGIVPLESLVRMMSMQSPGTFLTYAVTSPHGYRYHCLMVSDEQATARAKKGGSCVLPTIPASTCSSPSSFSSASSTDSLPTVPLSPKDSLALRLSGSPYQSPRSKFGLSPRGAVFVCVPVDSPCPSPKWLEEHGCTFPLQRKESLPPTPSFVPLWLQYACESEALRSPTDSLLEDPSYVLEILTAMTEDMALMERINKYQAKLTQIEEAQAMCECDELARSLRACHAEVKLALQEFKLSLYQHDGPEIEDDEPPQPVGFLSLSAGFNSKSEDDEEDFAIPSREASSSEALTVGFMWAVEVPPAPSRLQ